MSILFIIYDWINNTMPLQTAITSPPLNIIGPTSQQYTENFLKVTIEWSPPVDNGGTTIVNYTVNISPSAQLSATVGPSTTVNVTADYNVNYALSIVATNCAGNSDPAVYTFSISKFSSLP